MTQLTKRKIEDILPKSLEAQLERFIGVLETYNRKLPHSRSKKNYPFLRHFFRRFLLDQNSRSLEVSSSTYEKTKNLANQQFPVKTLWNLCIDGRVMSILAHGASAGIGSSVRVPGGMLREFVRAKNGKLMLDPSSDFAMLLKKALLESKNNILAEVFDSHVDCAARAAEEQLKGKYPEDSGLLADVSHKMQMAEAAIAFAKQTYGDEKKLMVIQTSFDPHTGFMYMGLETPDALLYVYKRGNVYTNEVLKNLTRFGTILSTEEFVSDENIRTIFAKYGFRPDWKENYVKSANLFWKAIAEMKKSVSPLIEKKIQRVYPRLVKNDRMAKIELEERVILMLTNASSAYLHNLDKKKRYDKNHENHVYLYPYGVHREEGVKVGEGGHPPYTISAFSVFSFEEKDLPTNIQLAASLVRNNRREKRITDASHTFMDSLDFTRAAVPLIVLEIIRDVLTEKEWEKLLAIDWRDMPENWDSMSDDAFYGYLHNKGILHFGVAFAINNLRRKLAVMYEIHSPISSRLIEQYSVALPIISSRNRRVRAIIPFMKLGY